MTLTFLGVSLNLYNNKKRTEEKEANVLYYLNRYRREACCILYVLSVYVCLVCYRHVMDYMPQEFKGVNLLRNERR